MLEQLENYNVFWDSPSKDASGSMPLGNGDIAANFWVEPGGDLLLLISKADAWDENSINLKLGRIRLRITPNPLEGGANFCQQLILRTADIAIQLGQVRLRIWIDANQPVIRIEADGDAAFAVEATLEMWRTKPYPIDSQTGDIFRNLQGKNADPYPTIVTPDKVLSEPNRIVWCHHNEKREHDGYEINMRLQGLGGLIGQMPHPLLGRTFGAAMLGDGFESAGEMTLKAKARTKHRLSIVAHSEYPATIEQWKSQLNAAIKKLDPDGRRAHERWWASFWDRSWIWIHSPGAEHVVRGYVLQRFMNACAGRGALPIKFNGSLFTYGSKEDPDWRRWGGPGFWFMNSRLVYWPMLAAGDYDLIQPWLDMYRRQLPLQTHRTKTYYGHGGAHYPETSMFWGAEVSAHYEWTPFEQRATPEATCAYIRYYWSGGIELVLILLTYYQHTGDEQFLRETLLPIADAVTEFFDVHWPRDAGGKIRFEPAQSLETWHEATNPLPEIAGLKYVLSELLAGLSPSSGTPGRGRAMAELRARWERMLSELPLIPLGEKDGRRVILPAERFDRKKNAENPELYCIFPYRLFGVEKPDLQLARDTFAVRLHTDHDCWSQDDIHMAMLGLTEQAKDWITKRARPESHGDSRFPAFWNAFHDWIPDMDHGGVLQMALQLMLMQCEGRTILLLPAWPEEWEVDFKLHAPFQTTVEGRVQGGKVIDLRITPESRRADVQILLGDA